MPKASTRFRNRKINFRTRIPIRTGPIDLASDQEEDEFAFEDDRRQSLGGSAGERGAVETGVDKEEESELHLQKVINASTAALLRSAVNERLPASSGVLSEAANAAAQSSTATHAPEKNEEVNVPHIPIPDATGLADPAAYEALYGHSKIFLPSSYIRFSDTVEDMLSGVIYTMDEEDQIWLNSFNAEHSQSNELSKAPSSSTPDESAKARRVNGRKGKEKERVNPEAEGLGRLSEDDFEALMDHFEKTTEETVPGLHLDTNRLPSLADLEHTFEGTLIPPRLSSIKIFAKFVYSHWKERRLKRGGKPIIPAIDFDETNENNPYVCFRRREIKMVRKTRRTDAQNMDRLIRLRNDLYKAQELLNTVVTRERVKREAVELEKAIFEGRCLIREMKRSLKEADGDEDLLVSKKEKRRKREESGNGTLKSPLRKAAGLGQNGLAPGEAIVHDDVQFSREQARASARLMDRDFNRCREEQSGWEDITDSCYLPMAPSAAALRWRGALCPDSASATKAAREGTPSFEQGLAMSPSVMEHNQFRKRVGRGGRFLLDRIIAPRRRTWSSTRLLQDPPAQSEEAIRCRKLADRWRYDDDLTNDFPDIDDPLIIDDYSLAYSSRRRNLLDLDDLDCLEPHSETYLNRVSEFLGRAPEPEPPIMKIGKLPGKAAAPNFGPGLGRTNLPVISPASLQEQIMSGQGSLQSQGQRLNQAAARRTASGPSMTNATGATQVMPRICMNPPATPTDNTAPGSAAPATHGQGSPHGQQSLHPLIALSWPNGSNVASSASGPSSTSSGNGIVAGVTPNRVPSPQHAQLVNQMAGSYSANSHSGGLSRSITVPANGSPASRGINGITIPNILPANSLASSHSAPRPSSSGSGGMQHQATPFISRPGSASSPPASQQVASRNPSPNTIQVKVSPGTRSVKRPAPSLGQHHSPPPGSIPNHLLNCNPPSPSPSTVSTAQGQAAQHPSGPAGSLQTLASTTHGGSTTMGKTPVKGQMMHHASHHSPLHFIHAHPVSPHHGIPGNVFNPMFGHHQSSPSQGGQNGANGATGATAGGVPASGPTGPRPAAGSVATATAAASGFS